MDISVAPWNGRQAAVSLTYDDGDPSHSASAIPMMDERNLRGTFFLTSSVISRWSDAERRIWKAASANGHEMASHTVDHPHAKDLSPAQTRTQIIQAARTIRKTFGTYPCSFAYPYAEISPAYREILPSHHFASRGGHGDDYYLPFGGSYDWNDIPSQVTFSDLAAATYAGWIDTALAKNSWTVFMIHGIEGTRTGWEPIRREVFTSTLSLLDNQRKKIWTAPFGEVAAYVQAARIFEQAAENSVERKGSEKIRWKKPRIFPHGTFLKLRCPANRNMTQKGSVIRAEPDGFCRVSFDAEVLETSS